MTIRVAKGITDPVDAEGKRRRLSWSQLIRKVYEIDPLLCPFCGSKMRIVAFLIDFASLRRLLGHLGFAPQQPEPLARAPPTPPRTEELARWEYPGFAD